MGESVTLPGNIAPLPGRFAGRVVRLILSLLVVAGLLTVVYLAVIARVMMAKSAGLARENVAIAGGRNSNRITEDVDTPWPHFPGCQPSSPSAMTINGIRTVGEEWNTSASAAEILDFLKEQMSVRGWLDVTEERYGLKPDFRAQGEGRNGLQNEDYIKAYAATVESCLVMRNRSRFMQVSLEPGEEKGRIRVSLFVAETSSYEAFSQGLASSLGSSSFFVKGDRIAEFSEKSYGSSYNTRMINSGQDSETAAREMIAKLKVDKWQTVAVSIPQTGESEKCWAVFQRGNRYAYLVVNAAEEGRGSSSVLTEVTEE